MEKMKKEIRWSIIMLAVLILIVFSNVFEELTSAGTGTIFINGTVNISGNVSAIWSISDAGNDTNCSAANSCPLIVYTNNATWAQASVNNTALNLGNAYNVSMFNITANSSAYVQPNTKLYIGSMWILYNSTTGAIEMG
jgi:hypothetical protein